jgi:hypothetical protein
MLHNITKQFNNILDCVENIIMPPPSKDALYQAVDENDIYAVEILLKNQRKDLLDRSTAYQHAIDLNYLKIAHLIRKSYTQS